MLAVRRHSIVTTARLTARVALLVLAAAGMLGASGATAQIARGARAAVDPPSAIDVVSYDAAITPDLATRSVTGQVRIRMTATRAVSDVTFDRGVLIVDAVREATVAQSFDLTDRHVVVHLRTPLGAGQTRDLDVTYHGTPGYGLQFAPERSQVYTIFTTSDWMVSADEPDDRATLRLRVTLPEALEAVGVGAAARTAPAGTGLRVHEWRLDAPAPTYTFGFAAGPFTAVSEGRVRLLGAGFPAAELRRIFADTEAMLRFFERRAGVPYPHGTYTQALVVRTVGQEMSGLSLLPEAYGRGVLDDPAAIALGAHEAAHQWWGNLVTCQAWTHFWLNEGMATFMAAAFLEERFGRAAYDRAVERFRTEYARVRDAGGDKPLVFPDWKRPSADDRTLVYQKGALVLHELRTLLGDDVFWTGVRDYTRAHAGRSVTTADFQRAIETSSGRDLRSFFDRWVYLR